MSGRTDTTAAPTRARLGARWRVWLPAGALLAGLAGCEGETQELQAWMDQQRREVRPRVQALAAPKKFDPVPYANAQLLDPF